MIQLSLDRAGEFLGVQTPKDFVQQLAAGAEMLRRARVKPTGGQDKHSLLEELRASLSGRDHEGDGTDG